MKYDVTEKLAIELIALLRPTCEKVEAVGALRRKADEICTIEILCLPKTAVPQGGGGGTWEIDLLGRRLLELEETGDFLPADPLNRLYRFHLAPVRIYRANRRNWGALLYHTTAALDLQIYTAMVAKAKGCAWIPEDAAFVDRKTWEPKHRVESPADAFAFCNLPELEPERMDDCPPFELGESGAARDMTPDELRGWAAQSVWVDTKSGGEWHQFTIRGLNHDEKKFVHLVETIRRLGYDGTYHGKDYRYLDLDGYRYFTQGDDIRLTCIINRKILGRPEWEWKYNPEPYPLIADPLRRLEKAGLPQEVARAATPPAGAMRPAIAPAELAPALIDHLSGRGKQSE